jgi:putative ABC transport system permease protein
VTTPRTLGARVSALFHRRALDERLEAEIDAHIGMLAEEYRRRGMPSGDARRAALVEFGGLEQTKERWRDQGGLPWVEGVVRDLGFAVRMIRRRPGVSCVVAGALALGIGAAVTLSSIVGTLFLRPLAYPAAERLVLAGEAPREASPAGPVPPVPWRRFEQWRARATDFDAMGAYSPAAFAVNPGRDAVLAPGEYVTEGYFETLGMRALMGRTLEPGDFAPGAPPAAVLSHRCWRELLGGDPRALGRALRVEGRVATVVGIMPPGFRASALEGGGRLWVPFAGPSTDGGEGWVYAIARLRAGAAAGAARVELATLSAGLAPAAQSGSPTRVRVENMQDHYSNGARSPLAALLAIAVACVFLTGCANASNLLLARGFERRREIAMRLAMGASRARIVRQLALEYAFMALAGAAAGVLLAWVAIPVLSRFAQPLFASTGIERFEIDGRALALALALAPMAAFAAGIVPAMAGARLDFGQALKEAAGTITAGRARRRLVSLLVFAQVVISVVLACETALVVKAISSMARFDWGFPVENRISMPLRLSGPTSARQAFVAGLRSRAAAVPGVRSAALASSLPIQLAAPARSVHPEGTLAGAGTAEAAVRIVSGEYLATLAIPLRKGRNFDDSDRDGGEPVALINDDLARTLWPDRDPLGSRIEVDGVWRTVVGVTAGVAARGMLFRGGGEVLIPIAQSAPGSLELIALTAASPGAVLPSLRAAIREWDRDQPVAEMQTLADLHRRLCRPLDFVVLLLGGFAVTALVLAAVGVYAVMAHSVNSRAHDLGIRMALGASARRIVRDVLRAGMPPVAWGVLAGALLGTALARVLASRLWWLRASPLALLVPVGAVLLAAAMAACWRPAARAAAIDPAATLRSE